MTARVALLVCAALLAAGSVAAHQHRVARKEKTSVDYGRFHVTADNLYAQYSKIETIVVKQKPGWDDSAAAFMAVAGLGCLIVLARTKSRPRP